MANQAIALGVRGPQVPDLARVNQQYGQIMNMMTQQRAAERQAAQAQQAMEFAAAKEGRERDLHGPALAEAQSKATAADIKTGLDFNNFVRVAIANASTPEQVEMFAERIAGIPQFQTPLYQGVLQDALEGMPRDPAQFGQWRKETYLGTLEAGKRYETELQRIQSGGEEFTVAVPKLSPEAGAMEVPGTRGKIPEGIQYIKDDDGNIYAMPKTTGGGGAPSVGGGSVASALKTNPGALKDGPFARSQSGYVGSSGGFAVFKTPQDGIAAQEKLLTSAYIGKGFNTIDKIVNRYAPQGPENSAASVANYKKYISQRTGIDINAPIAPGQVPALAEAMREFETGQTKGGGAPTPVIKGSGKGGGKTTEAERRFGTISRQMRTNLKEAVNILTNNPDAIRPTGWEYAASQLPFVGEEARLWAQSEPRQQFEASILRFLDNVTFVNTGAGTSKAQEDNYRRSYIPTYQDTNASAHRKLQNMVDFARNVKDAAGVLWTPELDADFNALSRAVERLKPKGKAKPKPAPAPRTTPTGSSIPKDIADMYGL